ncbi:endoglucanase [Brevibacillus nitrificans]|nr:endoglucanase [Brevibacillus nitrificans]
MDQQTAMMKKLSEADGVAGDEYAVREVMNQYLEGISEEIVTDHLGSVLGVKKGVENGPKILLAGHMDEVGFMVSRITKQGFLKFQQLGGWWPHTLLSQRVKIRTKNGDVVGIIGSKPPHILTPEEREKVVPLKDLYIDIGAKNKEEAEEMGVLPGDSIVPCSEFFTMGKGDLWVGKAIDNRIGCALAIEVLADLQDKAHPNVIYAGATVQEEVGLRGAATMANLVEPDIAFALDVGVAYDTPGLESYEGPKVGEGPTVVLLDSSMVSHVGLRRLVVETAKEIGVPLQFEISMGGGTDAGKFHVNGKGCPSLAIGFATRYIHSHQAVASRSDFMAAKKLLLAVIEKLDWETVRKLQTKG